MYERSKYSSVTSRLLLNLAVFAGFVAIEAVLVRSAERMVGTWQAVDIAQLTGCVVAAALALRFRARLAAYIVAAFAAVFTAELAIHLYYGIPSAQGAPTHFAVLASAVLGVAFGAVLAGYWSRNREATPRETQPAAA
jgi:hypothetical protein